MKDKNISQGLWADTAPDKPLLTAIQGDQTTDIAIIGGGYTGLSAALHLAKMGKESIVLEAEDIGHGGAGRNVGLVNAGLWLMPEDLLRLANAALKAGAQLYKTSPVTGFEKNTDGWKLNTPTGTVTAKSVIIAVHAYPHHAFKTNKKAMIRMNFFQVGDTQLEYGWYGTFAMTTNNLPRFHVLDKNMAMVTSFNGRGIGPRTVFGRLLAEYITGGSPENIPLPVSKIDPIHTRNLWELFYETGARVYHFIQRRI